MVVLGGVGRVSLVLFKFWNLAQTSRLCRGSDRCHVNSGFRLNLVWQQQRHTRVSLICLAIGGLNFSLLFLFRFYAIEVLFILVLKSLPFVNLFALTDVFPVDIASYGQSVNRLLAQGVTQMVNSHSVSDSVVRVEFAQVVLKICVAVRHEVREVHDFVIVRKGILKLQRVKLDTLRWLLLDAFWTFEELDVHYLGLSEPTALARLVADVLASTVPSFVRLTH